MVKEAILDYVIYNSKIYPSEQIESSKGKNACIYEVIRVIDGIPLYLGEHISRLRKSAKLINKIIDKTDRELINEISKLIEINNQYNQNVKILCTGREKSFEDIYIYFVKSFYPSKEVYEEGINTILYESERENPNAKIINQQFREKINMELRERNAFESLLVNDNNQITEGSRSNVFFVKSNKLYTPPANEVLLGVTRSKIMKLCMMNGIEIIQQGIELDELKKYEGAFITGTSIDVLPIKNIDEIRLDSSKNDIILKVMGIYKSDKTDYISKIKNIK